MPNIYQCRCESCGHTSDLIHGWFASYRTDDGRLFRLTHPCEGDDLERLNAPSDYRITEDAIIWSKVCLACGTPQEAKQREVIVDRKGNTKGPFEGRRVGALRRVLEFFFEPIRMHEILDYNRNCRKCGSENLERIDSLLDKEVLCPQCSRESFRISRWGVT